MKNIYKVKGNIFITSDEEIKDCYVLTDLDKIIKVDESNEEQWHEFNCEKIILTTDEQLISDGVQRIDEEFLEWFVKNPSCEKVLIDTFVSRIKALDFRKTYTTIIPKKEQPKQGIDIQEFEKKANEIIANVGKKETLEEAVDKYTPLRIEQKAFIAGAEYQAKRMYSEKEVLEIIRQYALEEHLITSSKPDIWFEQFKKK